MSDKPRSISLESINKKEGIFTDEDKDGWRYYQHLPYTTKLLPQLLYQPSQPCRSEIILVMIPDKLSFTP